MVVHLKSLNRLVVLNDWVEWFFFQLLPVPAQVVFCVRVEQQQEVLNVRNHLLQLEVIACWVQLERLLFKFSYTVWGFPQRLSDLLVDVLLVEFVLFWDGFLEAVVLDHPEVLEVHEESSEDSNELFELFGINFSDRDNLVPGESLLSADEQSNKFLELFLIAEKHFAPEIKHVIKEILNILDMGESLDV